VICAQPHKRLQFRIIQDHPHRGPLRIPGGATWVPGSRTTLAQRFCLQSSALPFMCGASDFDELPCPACPLMYKGPPIVAISPVLYYILLRSLNHQIQLFFSAIAARLHLHSLLLFTKSWSIPIPRHPSGILIQRLYHVRAPACRDYSPNRWIPLE
jgi:hypothetical protein